MNFVAIKNIDHWMSLTGDPRFAFLRYYKTPDLVSDVDVEDVPSKYAVASTPEGNGLVVMEQMFPFNESPVTILFFAVKTYDSVHILLSFLRLFAVSNRAHLPQGISFNTCNLYVGDDCNREKVETILTKAFQDTASTPPYPP